MERASDTTPGRLRHTEVTRRILVTFCKAVIARFYADLVVEDHVTVEVKAVRALAAAHQAQPLHDLR
jgi:GxxExxY protein